MLCGAPWMQYQRVRHQLPTLEAFIGLMAEIELMAERRRLEPALMSPLFNAPLRSAPCSE